MNNGLDDDFTLLSLRKNLRCNLRNILFREGLGEAFLGCVLADRRGRLSLL